MQTSDADVENRAQMLAGRILQNVRTSILLNLRFLESALFRLNPTPARTTIATNGEQLYYGFAYLFEAYKQEGGVLVHAFLHVLMHCIFRHPFVSGLLDADLWNLSTDIAAEVAIDDLDIPMLNPPHSRERDAFLQSLKTKVPNLTAEKLYHYFFIHPGQREKFLSMAPLFHVCDHSIWYSPPETEQSDDTEESRSNAGLNQSETSESSDGADESESAEGGENERGTRTSEGSTDKSENQNSENSADDHATHLPHNDSQSGLPSQTPPRSLPGPRRQQMDEMWQDISRHVQVDMETFSKEPGSEKSNMVQQLQALNRERYDYRTFLRRFAQRREVMKINPDEFDHIFYTYGLKLYDKMPLIEPLEYKEDKRIREFVIIIDTSGSTSGHLVQTFLQKTYNILMTTQTFDSRVTLYIIQCDNTIQDVQKITSEAEFKSFSRNLKIRGHGGTDFRPAFKYVDNLIRKGDLTQLKGILYFTDGYGTYPSKKPAYDAAFVFIRNEYDEPYVPPWAIKLVLDDEDVENI